MASRKSPVVTGPYRLGTPQLSEAPSHLPAQPPEPRHALPWHGPRSAHCMFWVFAQADFKAKASNFLGAFQHKIDTSTTSNKCVYIYIRVYFIYIYIYVQYALYLVHSGAATLLVSKIDQSD